jgi:DNA invertase Pin-like site-specific DNA recombinase
LSVVKVYGPTVRAVIYTRVSSDPRGVGRSVEEQEADCRAIAERESWPVVRVFVDNDRGASRYSNGDRPEYRKLVDYLAGDVADVLVTWEASRAQRDLEAYVRLRDLCRARGVLWSYSGRTYDLSRTDDAFTTGLDALLAEREASVTRDRVLRAVRANAAEGRPHGKLLFGYAREYDERTGQLVRQVVREDQAAIVREAARRVLAGETPYAVAQDLNTRKIPAPRGGQWDLTQVKRLLTNPAYISKRVHRGKVVADVVANWPPILDETTFYALTAKLTDPARRTQRDSAVRHLLSGIAVCGVCGSRVRVQKNRGYRSYMCVSGFHVSRREDWVDELVENVAVARLARPDILDLLADDEHGEEIQAARAEVAEKRARLESFYDAAAAGELTPAALSRIEARLLPEIESARARAHHVAIPTTALREIARPDAARVWRDLPLTTKREVISVLMTVRIMPTKRGGRTFNPANVEIEWKMS